MATAWTRLRKKPVQIKKRTGNLLNQEIIHKYKDKGTQEKQETTGSYLTDIGMIRLC